MAGPYLFGPLQRRRRHVRAGLHAVPHLCGAAGAGALRPIATRIFEWPLMQEWTQGAYAEPDEIVELEVEF